MERVIKKNRLFFYLCAFIGTTFVGFAPLFVRSTGVGPITAGFYRIFLALPFLALWMSREKTQPIREIQKRDWLFFLAYGLLFSLDITFWNLSVHYTTVVNASLFNNFAAFFVPLLVWAVYKERPKLGFVQGAALALVGSLLLVKGNFKLSQETLLGDGLALISAVCYASYFIIIKNLRMRFGTGTILFFGGACAVASLSCLAFFEGGLSLPQTAVQASLLLGFALCSQVAGQGLIAFSMGKLSSSTAALILLTQPVTSAFLAYLLFGESISAATAIGGALVLASLYIVQKTKDQPSETH